MHIRSVSFERDHIWYCCGLTSFQWGGKGTSRDTCSEIFHGSNAFSEPETKAVANFISGQANRIRVRHSSIFSSTVNIMAKYLNQNQIKSQVYLTLHSYGQYFLIPWGYDVAFPSDYNDMLKVAKSAASKFRRYKFTVGNSADLLYPAAGMATNDTKEWRESLMKFFIFGYIRWFRRLGQIHRH